jgi:hypothetical protein
MLFMIAQSAAAGPEWAPVVAQAGIGGYMIYWFTTSQAKQLAQMRDAIDRLVRTNLLQLLAHPALGESAKNQANGILKELEAAEAEYKR